MFVAFTQYSDDKPVLVNTDHVAMVTAFDSVYSTLTLSGGQNIQVNEEYDEVRCRVLDGHAPSCFTAG